MQSVLCQRPTHSAQDEPPTVHIGVPQRTHPGQRWNTPCRYRFVVAVGQITKGNYRTVCYTVNNGADCDALADELEHSFPGIKQGQIQNVMRNVNASFNGFCKPIGARGVCFGAEPYVLASLTAKTRSGTTLNAYELSSKER